MYSARVIEAAVEKYQRTSSLKLIRIPAPKVEDWVHHLEERLKRFKGEVDELRKDLTKEELAFIRNERVMSMLDFEYWCQRYCTIPSDGGGICKLNFWYSQRIFTRKMAQVEEEMHARRAANETVDGMLIVGHKSRQLGETMLGRAICMHRLTTQQHRRAMGASVDDDKIQELYDRDKTIYDNLPWWLRPELGYDEKRAHIYFEKLDSRIIYQVSSQKSGLGVGRQFDLGHLTELSTWINASAVELDFFPTLPQSITTFCLLESTAYGRGGWWHEFTERVRKGLSRRWVYVFIPWYAEPSKYRATPPVSWIPSEVAMLHAQKIHETSAEFIGHSLMIPRESLYWWETTREEYRKAGNLNFFLTNYCSTPEESFQHSGVSAFDAELIEQLRLGASHGESFEIVRQGEASSQTA